VVSRSDESGKSYGELDCAVLQAPDHVENAEITGQFADLTVDSSTSPVPSSSIVGPASSSSQGRCISDFSDHFPNQNF